MPVTVDFDVYEKPEQEEGSEYAELISKLMENYERTATLKLEPETGEDGKPVPSALTVKRILRQVNAAAKAAGVSIREWERTDNTVTVSVRKPRPRKGKPAADAESAAEPVVIGKAAA
jgi:hypothetical protein